MSTRQKEDLAAILKQALGETDTATSHRSRVAANDHEEKAPDVDLSNNVFQSTITNDNITERKKIDAMRDAFNKVNIEKLDQLKPEDVEALNQVIDSFETFYTSLQDRSIDTDLEAMRQLMDWVKNSVTPKMKQIITDLAGSDTKISECRDLLGVLEAARSQNMTIEQLKAAIRENDRLEKEIAEKKQILSRLQGEAPAYDIRVAQATQKIDDLRKSWGGGLRLAFGGVPQDLKDGLQRAQNNKNAHDKQVQDTTLNLADLEKQKNEELFGKDGVLKILRGFDMTQEGLQDQIVAAAQATIDTINGVRDSVKVTLNRVQGSEKALTNIRGQIDTDRKSGALMKSALSQAYENNQKIADAIGERVSKIEEELAKLPANSTEATLKNVELLTESTNHKSMLDSGERLNRILTLVTVSDAASSKSVNEAARIADSIQNNKDGLTTLHNFTLKAVSEAMSLVLHQFADDQNQEFRNALDQVAKNLGKTAEGTAEHALEQQQKYHEQKIQGIKDLIGQLDKASEILDASLKNTVASALTEEKVLAELAGSADGLNKSLEQATQVSSVVRDHLRKAASDTTEE